MTDFFQCLEKSAFHFPNLWKTALAVLLAVAGLWCGVALAADNLSPTELFKRQQLELQQLQASYQQLMGQLDSNSKAYKDLLARYRQAKTEMQSRHSAERWALQPEPTAESAQKLKEHLTALEQADVAKYAQDQARAMAREGDALKAGVVDAHNPPEIAVRKLEAYENKLKEGGHGLSKTEETAALHNIEQQKILYQQKHNVIVGDQKTAPSMGEQLRNVQNEFGSMMNEAFGGQGGSRSSKGGSSSVTAGTTAGTTAGGTAKTTGGHAVAGPATGSSIDILKGQPSSGRVDDFHTWRYIRDDQGRLVLDANKKPVKEQVWDPTTERIKEVKDAYQKMLGKSKEPTSAPTTETGGRNTGLQASQGVPAQHGGVREPAPDPQKSLSSSGPSSGGSGRGSKSTGSTSVGGGNSPAAQPLGQAGVSEPSSAGGSRNSGKVAGSSRDAPVPQASGSRNTGTQLSQSTGSRTGTTGQEPFIPEGYRMPGYKGPDKDPNLPRESSVAERAPAAGSSSAGSRASGRVSGSSGVAAQPPVALPSAAPAAPRAPAPVPSGPPSYSQTFLENVRDFYATSEAHFDNPSEANLKKMAQSLTAAERAKATKPRNPNSFKLRWEQIDAMAAHGDPVKAGVINANDPPDVRAKKLADFHRAMRETMVVNVDGTGQAEVGRKDIKAAVTENVRSSMANAKPADRGAAAARPGDPASVRQAQTQLSAGQMNKLSAQDLAGRPAQPLGQKPSQELLAEVEELRTRNMDRVHKASNALAEKTAKDRMAAQAGKGSSSGRSSGSSAYDGESLLGQAGQRNSGKLQPGDVQSVAGADRGPIDIPYEVTAGPGTRYVKPGSPEHQAALQQMREAQAAAGTRYVQPGSREHEALLQQMRKNAGITSTRVEPSATLGGSSPQTARNVASGQASEGLPRINMLKGLNELKPLAGYEHAENAGSVEAANRLKQKEFFLRSPDGKITRLNNVDSIDMNKLGPREMVFTVDRFDGSVTPHGSGDKLLPAEKKVILQNLKGAKPWTSLPPAKPPAGTGVAAGGAPPPPPPSGPNTATASPEPPKKPTGGQLTGTRSPPPPDNLPVPVTKPYDTGTIPPERSLVVQGQPPPAKPVTTPRGNMKLPQTPDVFYQTPEGIGLTSHDQIVPAREKPIQLPDRSVRPGPPPSNRDLIAQQQTELDALSKDFNQYAKERNVRPGTAEYDMLQKAHQQRADQIRSKYAGQDTRIQDLQASGRPFDNTGGKKTPTNVKGDIDLTATDAGQAYEQGRDWIRGGKEVKIEPHKIVNKTDNITVFQPDHPTADRYKVGDPDSYFTEGGKAKTGVKGAVDNKLGYITDNNKKFTVAEGSGDIKEMAKAVSKAGTELGLDKQNPQLYEKLKNLRDYRGSDEAGATKYGDDPARVAKELADLKAQMKAEMAKAQEAARAGNKADLANLTPDQKIRVQSSNARAQAEVTALQEGLDTKQSGWDGSKAELRDKVRANFQDSLANNKGEQADLRNKGLNQESIDDLARSRQRVKDIAGSTGEAVGPEPRGANFDNLTKPTGHAADTVLPDGTVKRPASTLDGGKASFAKPKLTVGNVAGTLGTVAMIGAAGQATVEKQGEVADQGRTYMRPDEMLDVADKASGFQHWRKNYYDELEKQAQADVRSGQPSSGLGTASAVVKAMGKGTYKTMEQMGDGMINDPARQAILEEEEAARREGRDPNYLKSYGKGVGKVIETTLVSPITTAITEHGTLEERRAAGQMVNKQKALLQDGPGFVADDINKLRDDLVKLSDTRNHDPNDPWVKNQIKDTQTQLQQKYNEMETYGRMTRNVLTHDPTAGDTSLKNTLPTIGSTLAQRDLDNLIGGTQPGSQQRQDMEKVAKGLMSDLNSSDPEKRKWAQESLAYLKQNPELASSKPPSQGNTSGGSYLDLLPNSLPGVKTVKDWTKSAGDAMDGLNEKMQYVKDMKKAGLMNDAEASDFINQFIAEKYKDATGGSQGGTTTSPAAPTTRKLTPEEREQLANQLTDDLMKKNRLDTAGNTGPESPIQKALNMFPDKPEPREQLPPEPPLDPDAEKKDRLKNYADSMNSWGDDTQKKMDALQQQINDSRDSSKKKEMQAQLADLQKTKDDYNNRVNETQQELRNLGVNYTPGVTPPKVKYDDNGKPVTADGYNVNQLNNNNWQISNQAGSLGDDIAKLQAQIFASHNTPEKQELMQQLQDKFNKLNGLGNDMNDNNKLLNALGQNNPTLSGMEPNAGDGKNIKIPQVSVLAGVMGNFDAEKAKNTTSALANLELQQKDVRAGWVSYEAYNQIKNILDAAGYQGNLSRSQAAQLLAQAQQGNSWGNIIGNSLVDSLTQGGTAFGQTVGGAGANVVKNVMQGTKPPDSGGGGGDGSGGSGPGGGDGSGPTSTSTGGGGSNPGGGGGEPPGGGGGTNPGGGGDQGIVGSQTNPDGTVTVVYSCGNTWTGTPPAPVKCPKCGQGDQTSTTTNPGGSGPGNGGTGPGGGGGGTTPDGTGGGGLPQKGGGGSQIAGGGGPGGGSGGGAPNCWVCLRCGTRWPLSQGSSRCTKCQSVNIIQAHYPGYAGAAGGGAAQPVADRCYVKEWYPDKHWGDGDVTKEAMFHCKKSGDWRRSTFRYVESTCQKCGGPMN